MLLFQWCWNEHRCSLEGLGWNSRQMVFAMIAKAIHQDVRWTDELAPYLLCPWSSILWQLPIVKTRGRWSRATHQLLYLLGVKWVVWPLTSSHTSGGEGLRGHSGWLLPAPGTLVSCATLLHIRDQSSPSILYNTANDQLIDLMGKVHLKAQNPERMTKCNDSYDCFLEQI